MIYVITSIFLQCKEVSSAPDILLNQDDKVSTRCNHGYTNFTTTRHVFFRVLNLDHLSFIKKKNLDHLHFVHRVQAAKTMQNTIESTRSINLFAYKAR